MNNILQFLKYGGIHIKKKNKGLFTNYCNGKVTQECINRGKHSSNPITRKRATFADNARHWVKKGQSGLTVPQVKINGKWQNLTSDGQGNLSAGNKQFKVKTKPQKAYGNDVELIVTPQKNKIVADKDRNKVETSYSSAYHPEDVLEGFNVLTFGGMNNLSPTQWARRAYDLKNVLNGDMSFGKYAYNWVNGNNGIVSDNFAKENPGWATAINTAADITTLGVGNNFGRIKNTLQTLSKPKIYNSSNYNINQIVQQLSNRIKNLKLSTPHNRNKSILNFEIAREVPSPYNQLTTNKMSIQELLTPLEESHKALLDTPKTSLAFFERHPAKISQAERMGIPKGERNQPKNGNAASMTPGQWTAAQDAAIARGDMAEAQRLRNLHGAVNDYHSGFYHETKEPFVKFNRPGKNSTGDLLSPFGVFTKRTNKSIGLGEYQMPLNVRYNNPLHVKDKKELFEMLPKDLQKEINTLYRYQFHNTDQSLWNKRAFSAKQKIGKFLEDNNYDALIIDKDWAGTGLVKSERWTDATIVPSPGRVKSADAVTFDNNGVRIPLGERDNFNINDIRYGLIPLTVGLYNLFNPSQLKYQKQGGKLNKFQQGGSFDLIEYIKAIENPNKVGWNGKAWVAPPEGKGYDPNQRGYGIDVEYNVAAKKLTEGRPGRYITDQENDSLMKQHLDYVRNVANRKIEGFNKLSPTRQGVILGMLYRGDSVKDINIKEPNDYKFFNQVHDYYRKVGVGERAKLSSEYLANLKRIPTHKIISTLNSDKTYVIKPTYFPIENKNARYPTKKGSYVQTMSKEENFIENLKEKVRIKNLMEKLKPRIPEPYKFKTLKKGGIIKASLGTTFGKINNFLGSDTGKSIINGITSIGSAIKSNKQLGDSAELAKSGIDFETKQKKAQAYNQGYNRALDYIRNIQDPNNPNAFGGDIFQNHFANQMANQFTQGYDEEAEAKKLQIDQQMKQQQVDTMSGAINSFADAGMNMLQNLLNKPKFDNSKNNYSVSNSGNKSTITTNIGGISTTNTYNIPKANLPTLKFKPAIV